jgi:hypothetical protein
MSRGVWPTGHLRVGLAGRGVADDVGRDPVELSNAAFQLHAPDPPVWTSVSSTSKSTTTGLAVGPNSALFLVVTAEALAHGRENLVGEIVESA